jgi:perosamine synthetase
MSRFRIPVYAPRLAGREARYVQECLETGWISSRGAFIERFEQGFAGWIGAPHAVAVCNGTVALHLGLLALGIGPGDEVIVPTFTYVASVNAITMTGASPVFVDSLEDTLQMDPDAVDRAVSRRTRAIMAVHLYGQPCDLDRLRATCTIHGLRLVEDCAEAIGTRWRGRHVGIDADVATFSFFGNKTLTTGEGGMVLSRHSDVAARARHLRGQGVSPDREYWHDIVGYNYRMTNVCAAIGCAQLESVDAVIARKREIAERYREGFRDSGLVFHAEWAPGTHSYWMCSVICRSHAERERVRRELAARGVETRPFFYPAHVLPPYRHLAGHGHPVAESLAGRGLNLPSFPDLSDTQVDEIVEIVRAVSGPYAEGLGGVAEAALSNGPVT